MSTFSTFLGAATSLSPLVFVGMWLFVTSHLSKLSGWRELSAKYPDLLKEPAIASFSWQAGEMRTVALLGVLKVAACEGGLRLGIFRLFAPFDRPFFVPWQELNVSIAPAGLLPVTLTFGNSAVSTLRITSELAQELQAAAGTRWPSAVAVATEIAASPRQSLLREWLTITTVAAAFFYIVPRLVGPATDAPSLIGAVLFPAIFFGIFLRLHRWLSRGRRSKSP